MTEPEWLECDNPRAMWEWMFSPLPDVSGTVRLQKTHVEMPPRKQRLWAVACCRRVEHLLPPEGPLRAAIDAAERYAAGDADERKLRAALAAALVDRESRRLEPRIWNAAYAACLCAEPDDNFDAYGVAYACGSSSDSGREFNARLNDQAALLRDAVGNPWHSWTDPRRPTPDFGHLPPGMCSRVLWLDLRWLTPDVLRTAEAIDRDRDYASLPVLADAIEEAGMPRSPLTKHLRQPSHVHGPHCSDRDGLWCAWESVIHCRGCWAVDLILGRERP
jgi:hypothetical protein